MVTEPDVETDCPVDDPATGDAPVLAAHGLAEAIGEPVTGVPVCAVVLSEAIPRKKTAPSAVRTNDVRAARFTSS